MRLRWLAVAACLAVPALARALPYVHDRLVTSPTATAGDLFGGAVAALDGVLIVGAPGSDGDEPDAGAAWIVDPVSGATRALSPVPRAEAGSHFGHAIAAVGRVLAVSAPHAAGATEHAGVVYLFDALTGTSRAVVAGPGGGGLFGSTLGTVATRLVVGAPFGANATGQAFLVDVETGAVVRTIRNPNAGAYDLFGAAVAGGGERIAIGAPLDDGAGANAGAVHVFDATGSRLWTVRSPRASAEDLFGAAVAFVGNDVLVGAPFDDGAAPDAGAAYLFDGEDGRLLQRFEDPEARRDARLGTSVASRGSDVLVGAPFVDGGEIVLFDVAGHALERLAAPEPRAGDQFGVAMAATGGVLAVGAWLAETGALHVFRDTATATTSTSSTTSTTSTSSTTSIADPPPSSSTSSTVGESPSSTTTTTTAADPEPPTTSSTLDEPIPGTPSTSTTVAPIDWPTTTTTLPESTLACDDGDACTIDQPDAGRCRSRPVPGREGALCRVDALAALVDAVAPEAVGGARLRARLRRRVAVTARLIGRAAAGPRATRKLARARTELRALLATIDRATRHGRTLPAVADGIRALAEDAIARLGDQNS